jgi:hypothetical protein
MVFFVYINYCKYILIYKYMKYLRKIFESSKEDQIEEIETVFYQWLDKKFTDKGEEYADAEVTEHNTHLTITIYNYESNRNPNDLKEFDESLKEKEQTLSLMKSIRVALTRLDYYEFKWGINIDEEQNFHIKVFFKETKLTLQDCFGGIYHMRRIDENIMKEVLKKDYNINYLSCDFSPSTQGYYGKRAYFLIYLKDPITQDNKIFDDLKNLKRKNRSSEDEYRAFYTYDIKLSDNGKTITLPLD